MKIYYDVVIRNEFNELVKDFLCDSFSMDKDRKLIVSDLDWGTECVQIKEDEYLVICEVRL